MPIVSNQAVWYTWNFGTSTSATQTYSVTTDGRIWTAWNGISPGTSGSVTIEMNHSTWNAWNSTGNAISMQSQRYAAMAQHVAHGARGQAYPQSKRTPEQIRQAEEDLARIRAATEKRNAEYEAERIRIERAKARAEATLHACLSPKQSEELRARGHFHLELVSANGERKRYRINRGRHGNVYQVDDNGKQIKRLCVHPTENVPDADTMLAQKLFLEGSEEELLRVANHS